MKRIFEFVTDPGHGWLKVDFETLAKLDLKLSDFSSCSYLFFNSRKGAMQPFIYLEEDCDAGIFAKRYKEVTGQEAKTRGRYTNQFAGRFNRYYFPNGKGYFRYFAKDTIQSGVVA